MERKREEDWRSLKCLAIGGWWKLNWWIELQMGKILDRFKEKGTLENNLGEWEKRAQMIELTFWDYSGILR